MTNKKYILNLETNKIELHFEKSEYLVLTENLKKELKSSFLFSRSAAAWVSRSTQNHYNAIDTAKKLGFLEQEKQGEKISYAEQLEKKVEKAENRAERYEEYAINAAKRGKEMQKELNSFHGDNSFFTQPNINSSRGRAFTNYRKKLYERYDRGFQEYQKSSYFQDRAEIARQTASNSQLQSRSYLHNRIADGRKTVGILSERVKEYGDILEKIINGEKLYNSKKEIVTVETIENALEEKLERYDAEFDKLTFFENCIKELGEQFTAKDLKIGYLVLVGGTWYEVTKVCPTNFQTSRSWGGQRSTPYDQIAEIKIPENWEEPKKAPKKDVSENPFKIDDIVGDYVFLQVQQDSCCYSERRKEYFYFQIITLKTATTLTMQRINVVDEVPQLNNFCGEPANAKTSKRSYYSSQINYNIPNSPKKLELTKYNPTKKDSIFR